MSETLDSLTEAEVFDALHGEPKRKATVVVGSVSGELLARRVLHRTTLSAAGPVALDAPLPNVSVERLAGLREDEWAILRG